MRPPAKVNKPRCKVVRKPKSNRNVKAGDISVVTIRVEKEDCVGKLANFTHLDSFMNQD
jgi:hypothetical protein